MRTHDRESLDDQQREGAKRPRKSADHGTVTDSMRDLQATAGNRAVSDLVGKAGPTMQGRFFGGGFGGIEEWMAKESPAAARSFDPSVKEEASDAGMKDQPSDESMKVGEDPADKWDGSEKADAADKWGGSEKVDAADKWDSSEKDDGSDKWDSSEKDDVSDKWDASEKTQPEFASKGDALTSKFDELEFQ
ncbi:MAG: hypothetical protein ABI401_09100 [Candidatus Dormibacter sp.]